MFTRNADGMELVTEIRALVVVHRTEIERGGDRSGPLSGGIFATYEGLLDELGRLCDGYEATKPKIVPVETPKV